MTMETRQYARKTWTTTAKSLQSQNVFFMAIRVHFCYSSFKKLITILRPELSSAFLSVPFTVYGRTDLELDLITTCPGKKRY